MTNRPKIAFFDLTGCEGCQLQITNLGESLLELLQVVDLVEFREVLSESYAGKLDLAFVEGSVSSQESRKRLRAIRKRTKNLVAYGSCATIGGVNGMKNLRPLEESLTEVYGDQATWYSTSQTRPLHAVVRVDYFVHGCPIYPEELLKVMTAALAGLPYKVPDEAVCVECKFNENICVFDRGLTCLGPVTRAGCNAWCINNGNVCFGCRGLVSNPNLEEIDEVFSTHGLDAELIVNRIRLYNAAMGATGES